MEHLTIRHRDVIDQPAVAAAQHAEPALFASDSGVVE
jgi:hypothetical protein